MASIARVVVEAGSDWPAFVRGAADEVVALSQATEDADGGALERACGRAEHSCTTVRLAVLACNADVDDESIRRRTVTASRLVEAVVHTAGGHFVLSARNHASAALQLGLIRLGATLRNAGRGSFGECVRTHGMSRGLASGRSAIGPRSGPRTCFPCSAPRVSGSCERSSRSLAVRGRGVSGAFCGAPCDRRPRRGRAHRVLTLMP
jgi:hypothetical protein